MEYSVCICTFRRPELLNALLHRLRSQTIGSGFEIVVVDNDPSKSADAVLQAQREYWGARLITCHSPVPNISVARNTAIAAAGGQWLALIDDDELPEKDWLEQLSKAASDYNADVVFAPVLPRYLPDMSEWLIRGRYFERPRMKSGTQIDYKNARSGNVLIRKSVLTYLQKNNGFIFDPAFGRSGGEDSLLFRQLDSIGAHMVWCDEAPVSELVPADRATVSWLIKRSYRTGALFIQTDLAMTRGTRKLMRGMVLGVRAILQALVALLLIFVILPFRPHRAFYWARIVASQFGKLSAFTHKPPQAYGKKDGDS